METKAKKAVVTDENRAESAALKEIYVARKHVHRLTQTEFGERFGIGTQAAVWMCLNGKMAISLKAGIGFSRGLRCDLGDFSPRLQAEAGAMASAAVNSFSDTNKKPIQDPQTQQHYPRALDRPSAVWPFDLFNYDEWMLLPKKDREEFENLIAGAVLRAKKTRTGT